MRTILDVNLMDWKEFHNIVNFVSQKIQNYSESNNIQFDLMVPILRSGGIPATILANSLDIRYFLPVQFGHIKDEETGEISIRSLLDIPRNYYQKENPNIIICETNTGSGKTAKLVIGEIRRLFPKSCILYTSVVRVYGGPENFEGIEGYIFGIESNEFFEADRETEERMGLRRGITIFPWENAESELKTINAE